MFQVTKWMGKFTNWRLQLGESGRCEWLLAIMDLVALAWDLEGVGNGNWCVELWGRKAEVEEVGIVVLDVLA